MTMFITILSVFLGFLFMCGAYASFVYKKPQKFVWTLFIFAVLFLTIIPLSLAIFVAA